MAPSARFAAELHSFERLLQAAFAAGGRLATAAVEAQADGGMSPVAGHQALAAFSAAQTAVAQALTHSAGGHRIVERLAKQLNLDVVAFGDGVKPPAIGDGEQLDSATARLA